MVDSTAPIETSQLNQTPSLAELMSISVIYAPHSSQVWHKSLVVPLGTNAFDAFVQADLLQYMPESTELENVVMGVFSHKIKQPKDYVLQAGDRVEIYHPLLLTPMDIRRIRAALNPFKRQVNPPREGRG